MTDAQERIGQSVGDYRLQRLLGKGRFGTVYLAEHLYEHTSAAVKVLHMPLTGPNDFDVFLKEARTVRLLHPHIVSLFDFDLTRDGLPYLAMTYAEGGSLRERYPRGSKLSLPTIETYVQQLASALQYTHDCHVIHHDVKPENMLMSNDGTVQLSDFGIARISGRASPGIQPNVVGTSAYTAPEQSQGQPGPASDQYALAIVAYEWLTGQCPFQGDPFAVASQHQMDTPPSLSSINPEVPLLVEAVIFKALAKAPKDRFPTITYFADALHAALDDEPTQIVPKLDISRQGTASIAPVSSPDTPAETSLPPQLVLASPPDAEIPDANELHDAPTWEGLPISTQDEAMHALPTAITPTKAPTEEKLQPQAMHQGAEIPAFLPGTEQPQHSSTLAKDRLKRMILHQPAVLHTPGTASQSPRPHLLSACMGLIGSFVTVVTVGARFAKKMILYQSVVLHMLGAAWQYLRPHFLSASRRLTSSFVTVIIIGARFAKKTIQHQPVNSRPPLHRPVNGRLVRPSQHQRPLPTWIRLIGSFLIVILVGGVFSLLLHLLPILLVSPTQKSEATPVSQVATQHYIPTQTPTPSPQRQTPTPIPTATPPVISAAIPAGKLLYSTPAPFSPCDKLGGHWTNASDARVTCNSDGSEMINTSGRLAVANLDQLGGNQSPWPCQNCIIQVQATINPNSQGAFGIDFQSDGSDNTQGYFAYVLNPPNNWAFSYYNTPGDLTSTLTASRLLSSVPTKLTIDIRVEGTYYTFYINGVDTTGSAVTGSQYINKFVGLGVDANADITFSNLAIYALA